MNGALIPMVKGDLGQALCQIGASFCEAERRNMELVLCKPNVILFACHAAMMMGRGEKAQDKKDAESMLDSVFGIEQDAMPYTEKSRPERIEPSSGAARLLVKGLFDDSKWFRGFASEALRSVLRTKLMTAEASERERLSGMAFIHFAAGCQFDSHIVYYSRAISALRSAVPSVRFEVFSDDMMSEKDRAQVRRICDACGVRETLGSFFSRTWKQTDVLRSMSSCGRGGVCSDRWVSWWAAFSCCSSSATFAVPAVPWSADTFDKLNFMCESGIQKRGAHHMFSVPIW
jgi:hypothetical protein